MGVLRNSIQILIFLHCTFGSKITDIDIATEWLADYNERAMDVYYNYMEAEWMFNTNITDENQEKQVSIIYIFNIKCMILWRTELNIHNDMCIHTYLKKEKCISL